MTNSHWYRSLALAVGGVTLFTPAMSSVTFAQSPPVPVSTQPQPLVGPPVAVSPVSSEAGVVNEAAVVLQELTTGTAERIPERLLAEAFAIAIIPHAMRGAFIVGLGGGRGVLVSRDASGRWQGPEFITFAGGSVGWQIGVQSNDLVLVFRTPQSVETIRRGRLTLGANATVATGPIGRYASADTDATLQAEILTYSRSRGLFAGVSLQGSALQLDVPATQRFYQIGPASRGVVPTSAQALVTEINRFSYRQPHLDEPALLANSGRTTSVADPRIASLSRDVAALQAKLDGQWQTYLALPADWLSGRPLTVADIQSVLIRYERVETNPMFEQLRKDVQFQKVLTSLRSLAHALNQGNESLVLPPPPRDAQ